MAFVSIRIVLVTEVGLARHVIWKNVQIIVESMKEEAYVSLNLDVDVPKSIEVMIVVN